MKYSERIQQVIHALEEGTLSRWLRWLPLLLTVVGLAVLYDLRVYRSFSSPEAMDAAQVARHLAEGKGYTTDFIRPFSLHLVQTHNRAADTGEIQPTNSIIQLTNSAKWAQLDGTHPDLANAPVYPTVLAGLMKLGAPDWKVELDKPFWSTGGRFLRFKPEFAIAVFNQFLLLGVAALTFLIARKLFDLQAALLSALLVLLSDLLWKFSVSGLSTMLLLVIFLGLVWCLAKIEELGGTELPDSRRMFALAITVGLITGLGMLTRYAFGWVIVPVVVYLGLFGGHRRAGLAVTAGLAFALAVTPWMIRNLSVSGTCWGTAGFAVAENTFLYPGSELMQSINPNLSLSSGIKPYTSKFMTNISSLFQDGIFALGGGWLGMLFFSGLLLGLRNSTARRLRYFTLMCLAILLVVQAMGKTSLSEVSPVLNTENLLVLLTPLVVIFGTVFFLTLLDQMTLPAHNVRYGVIGLLALLVALPLLTQIKNKTIPIAYPPYYPPEIQQVSGWMRPDAPMMSDMPWAVAWYGQHPCVWVPLDAQDNFYAIHKDIRPVQALYLTSLTMDGRFISDMMQGRPNGWGNFVYKVLKDQRLPDKFPLTKMPEGFFPMRLFLADEDRWSSVPK